MCPCGEPKDGHRHYEGYWRDQHNRQWADRMVVATRGDSFGQGVSPDDSRVWPKVIANLLG